MSNKFYCVGVGPGDPELMSVKAQRIITENNNIAVPVRTPGQDPFDVLSLKIASVVVDMNDKNIIPILIPMSKDRAQLDAAHKKAAQELEGMLEKGEDVVFLCLGDPSFYSSVSYLRTIVAEDGFETETVAGITSFSAAAARLGIPLAEWDEKVHVVPTIHKAEDLDAVFAEDGTYILMKSGKGLDEVKAVLAKKGFRGYAVENCGLPNEHVYTILDEIPDESGYFLLVIARK